MPILNLARLLSAYAFLGVLVLVYGAPPTKADDKIAAIGLVDDIRNEAFGNTPGAQPQQLVLDQPVLRDEHVKTGKDALLRVVFADNTTLLLGANSEITLDRFVYSGTKGTGQAVMKMSAGIFRFTSGNINKKGVALVTPVATIGIRGTDFIVDISTTGATRVTVLSGLVEMQAHSGGIVAIAPGQVGLFEPGQKAARLDLCAGGNCTAALRAAIRTKDLVQPTSAVARAATLQAISRGVLATIGQAETPHVDSQPASTKTAATPGSTPVDITSGGHNKGLGVTAQHGSRDSNSGNDSSGSSSGNNSSESNSNESAGNNGNQDAGADSGQGQGGEQGSGGPEGPD